MFRGYSSEKVTENVESEIMNVCEERAKESYDPKIIRVFENDDMAQFEQTVAEILPLIPSPGEGTDSACFLRKTQ